MENFFEEKIRNGNSLNADAIYAIYEKQRINEVYILLLGILKTRGMLEIAKININNLDLPDRQKEDIRVFSSLINPNAYNRNYMFYDEITKVLYSTFFNENLFNILLYNNSLWNENKEEIWQLIKSGKLPIHGLPEDNSLWEEKKDEIAEMIFGNDSELEDARKFELLRTLPPNHSLWTEKQEEIWQIILRNDDFFGILPENSELWNTKEPEIWQLVKENKIKLSIIPKSCILWKKRENELWFLPDALDCLHFFPTDSILWEEKKEEIWQFILSNNEALIELPISSSLWAEKVNDIIKILRERPDLIIYLPQENILWRDKKDELWDIIYNNGSITYLHKDSNLWIEKSEQIIELIRKEPDLLRNIRYSDEFWEKNKEKIWDLFAENRMILLVNMPKISPLWEEKKEEIWQLAQENPSIISMLPANHSLFREKKDEIWNLVKTRRVILKSIISKTDWIQEKKDEIWEMANSKIDKTFLAQIVDFNDVNEFRRYVDEVLLLEVNNKKRILLKNSVLRNRRSLLEETNPLSNQRLEKELAGLMEFSSIEGYSENLKEILRIILSRLEDIGVLENALDEDKTNSYLSLENCKDLDKLNILQRIYNLTDEKEIIYYTLFYINKLTKLNNITMYLNAMKKEFKYDKEKDNYIDTINKLVKLREKFYELKDSSMPGQFFTYVFKIIDDENENFSNVKNEEFKDILEEIKSMRNALIDIRVRYGDGVLRSLKIIAIDELNNYYEKREDAEKVSTQIIQEFRKLRKNYVGNFEEDLQNLDLENSDNEISKKIRELSEMYYYDANDIYDSFIYAEYEIAMQDRLYKIKEMLLERYIALDKDKVKAYKYQKEKDNVLETITNKERLQDGLIPYDTSFDIEAVLNFLEKNKIEIKDVTEDTFLTFLNSPKREELKRTFINWRIYIINEICTKNKKSNEVSEADFAVFKNPKLEYKLWRSQVWFKGKINDDFETQLSKRVYIDLETMDLDKGFEKQFYSIKRKLREALNFRYISNGTLEDVEETVKKLKSDLKSDKGLENINKKDEIIDILLDNWKALYQALSHEQEVTEVAQEMFETEQHQDILFVYNDTDILPNSYHCNSDNILGFEECLPESETSYVLERRFFKKVSRQIAFPFRGDEINRIKTNSIGVQDTPYYWIIYPGRALAQASRGQNGTGKLTFESVTAAGNVLVNDLKNIEGSLEINGEKYDGDE